MSPSLFVKATQQFSATVQGTGSFSTAVTWLVNNVQGGNSSVGTISNSGFYTAPASVPNSNPVTVTAKSVEDATKAGSSQVAIEPENVMVSISPMSGSVQLNQSLPFMAMVTGTANTAVFWSVNNFVGGQPAFGFIDGNGNYTAPSNLPANNPVTVTVTSQEDNTKSASAMVTVLATAGGITVTISPQNPNVVFDGSQSVQFMASVTGTANTAVTWSVLSNGAGPLGTITPGGLFTPFGFSCANVSSPALIQATSVADTGAQATTYVNLVPPTPVLTSVSPQPADAQSTLQLSGTFAYGATFTVFYPGPNGTSIPGSTTAQSPDGTSISGPVPLGTASGPLSVQQSCSSPISGYTYPGQESNALPFQRLSRLRIRSNRQILSTGESTQMLYAFLGDPTPQPITWSALYGTVSATGVYTAGANNWDKVTGCITGTQQCDFFVFSVVPARIDPEVPVVSAGGSIQLTEVAGGATLSPTWSIVAGGGTLNSSGLYMAANSAPDTGAIPVLASDAAGNATNAIGVVGGFPGMVNRLIDFPDISPQASGQTTIPQALAAASSQLYVLSDSLPIIYLNGHRKLVDVYDVSDPAHPQWTSAVEGFDHDLDVHPMLTFANPGALWRVSFPALSGSVLNYGLEVAFFDASGPQPVLKQFLLGPQLWVCGFDQGLLVAIPASYTQTGQSLWQSPVNALVFDGRSGTVVTSQIALPFQNPSTPVTVVGLSITTTRLFLLYQQQQADGSLPFFLSTYSLSSNPPALLQTTPSMPAGNVYLQAGGDLPPVFGNLLFTGTGIFDISSGLPVQVAPPASNAPADFTGSLALFGPFSDGFQVEDFSVPASPKLTSLLYSDNSRQARAVGNNVFVIGSGLEVYDITAPGGPLPQPVLQGSGTFAEIFDLAAVGSHLYAAEDTDVGSFVTSFDLSQSPPARIGSFALGSEVPLALAPDGNFLFVGTSTELVVLNVSNPAAPARVTSLPIPTSCLTLVGNLLYLGNTGNRLVVIDVTNPTAPVVGTSVGLAGFPNAMQASGNLLLIAADQAGLLAYSIATPAAPAFLSQFQPSSAVEGVAIDGNLALLAAADGGFVVADMTNPAVPVLAGQVPLAAFTCYADLDPADGAPALIAISVENGIAYLGGANMFGRVFGFDYRQASHPRLVSEASYGDAILESVISIAPSGSSMFVAGDLYADHVFPADATQPRNFIREQCFPPPFTATAVAAYPELQKRSHSALAFSPKLRLIGSRTAHP